MAHTHITLYNHDLAQEREYTIEKAIFFIGSDPGNDIVLTGTLEQGIYPRHIQVIAVDRGGYRMVNLGLANLTQAEQTIEPRTSVNLTLGVPIQLGPYHVTITDAEAVGSSGLGYATAPIEPAMAVSDDEPRRTARGKSMAMTISLSHTLLSMDEPIEGTITLRNLGSQPGVQFQLELEGLEPGSYELGPGPILFPNAEKSTFLRLRHPQKPFPVAGDHRFSVTAIAPEDYPDERAVVVQTIKILPFYKHKLRLLVEEED